MAEDLSSATASPQQGSIFSRRPSFFGGKHKHNPPKTPTHASHLSPPARSNQSPPPAINLLPVSPIGDADGLLPSQYEFPPKVPSTPPRRKHAPRHSISSTLGDIGTSLQRSRSASLRTNDSSGTASNTSTSRTSSHKRTPSANLATSLSPEKPSTANGSAAAGPSRPALSISTFARSTKQRSAENVRPDTGAGAGGRQGYDKEPLSAVDKPKTPFGRARFPSNNNDPQPGLRRQDTAGTTYGGSTMNYNAGGLGPAAPIPLPTGANPNVIFQHIQEMASKRISTLDYLRKAHEGRIYWFNTLLFARPDLTRLPGFTPRNLARRATHYLLLGFSLPTILDLNSSSPSDYLRALLSLLTEFEQYQSIHPADGSAPASLGRGRLGMGMGGVFKRVNVSVGGKGRRSSSVGGAFDGGGLEGLVGNVDSPPENDLLLPNESYSYLQTPSLPFDPDFFSTFATLCDVLMDSYTKILSLLSTPESIVVAGGGVPSAVGELFNKADAKVRKVILAGVVREFEEGCRGGVRAEVGGVGKVVLGGLM
ncbi:hypothetical protein BU23DRAFT_507174 [Bimuria novae-zelandiae CBS 107.79]|uniref:Uncharacterized protein n=1 Tax=Bimuria novae-zelandiae CBS 107.79 TaxID=1447943 RepID=A0A6A5VII4_9PLEO|nr:hypothetical protein BU23DRAFT_507174 [Bimuria novae-zelandiae CBS 107.79]